MEPQQVLFSWTMLLIQDLGYVVYDGIMPPSGTPYPFVYMGENQCIDSARKGAIQGTIYQTVHVYHNNVRERGTMSSMLLGIKNQLRHLENRTGFLISEMSSRILPDNTTDEPLLHGIISIGVKF